MSSTLTSDTNPQGLDPEPLAFWPPQYTLRVSTRARTVRLQICQRKGLQLVVPKHFKSNDAPEILQKHRRWIERTWLRINPEAYLPISVETKPTTLQLLAANEEWQITYALKAGKKLQLDEIRKGQLLFHGNLTNQQKIKKLLFYWLHEKAKTFLVPLLLDLSEKTKLSYSQVTIRNTHTRWGSCSSQKNISLNFKLLFLPPELVEHVLIHELCHTVHLNHGKGFWQLFKNLNPQCSELRKQLRFAQRFIPLWVE